MKAFSARSLHIAILTAMAGVIFWSCSHSPELPENRPGQPQLPAAPDYSSETAVADIRAKAGAICLSTADEGVMYITDGEEHSYVDLTSGSRIDFMPGSSRLRICGVERNVTESKKLQAATSVEWWAVVAPPDTAIIVIEK